MITLRKRGGEKVERGNYWNFGTGERIHVKTERVLPGTAETTYYKVSPVVVLLVGPFLGLLYAAFLPFIGIAMAVKLIAEKLFKALLAPIGQVVAFRWNPSAAYFSGKKNAKKQGKKTEPVDKKESQR